MTNNDIDENLPTNINCMYYTNDEFSKLPNYNNFNIFHSNVNGLESHHQELELVISESSLRFNVIYISETSQKVNNQFAKNILLDNYQSPYTTGTKSSKGGVAIYVAENLDTFERTDLKVCDMEYETIWTEIKNHKCKNIIIGCIYRHPHYQNLDKFMEYMNNTLNKLNKEYKEIYICGDFNIDLLKCENHILYQEFYNLMTSNSFMPQITLPTRITDSTISIIDNIYTNTFSYDIYSGNVLIEIADHLLQFISINKSKIEYKDTTFYKRDYKQFNEQMF